MNKMFIYVVTVAVIIAIGGVCMALAKEDRSNIEFLTSYDWEVLDECVEKEKVKIPEVFDEVYNNYNELQKEAGLDLTNYKGKNAIRYTYIVTNFPGKSEDEEIRANVLCVDNKQVAGDIMTVKFDGFMYSLNYLKTGR